MSETFWNGEPCNAVRGTALPAVDIPEAPDVTIGGKTSRGWPARPMGVRFPAVQVYYGGERHDLDDHDGRAWNKVTNGHGSPRYGHRSVQQAHGSFEPDDWQPIIREWAAREGLDPDGGPA